jgi:2-C-methyl-D-erythritol 2,4-cyclodiphosphate synthase
MRIGHGFDAHAFAAERKLVLGGVTIPNHCGLAGHSDADVLLHAIIDALLGAAAMGDIGGMFPDSDPSFENIDSRVLLRTAVKKLHAAGFQLGNLDATVIAQVPRLAPFIDTMRSNIADDCRVALECINVKATTTEKMGFTGRKEGIAAHAVVLLSRD